MKDTEGSLLHEHDLLQALMDSMPDYIFFKDRQSRFVRTNRAHGHYLGLDTPGDVVGRTDFDFFPKDDAQRFFEEEQRIMKTAAPVVERVWQATPSGAGDSNWLSESKLPLKDISGVVIGLMCIGRNVTDLRRAEEALLHERNLLKEAKELLEVRVQERTADLRDANEHLETRLKQLDFLNRSSFELSRYLHLGELVPAVLRLFVSRFSRAEAALCKRTADGFECLGATSGLDSETGRQCSELSLLSYRGDGPPAPVVTADWRSDATVGNLAWPGVAELPCYLVVPLALEEHVLSIVQIFCQADFVDAYAREGPLITTLASHAATSLSNAFYHGELGKQARVQGELDAARSIQRSFTPQFNPPIPHVDLRGVYHPAYEVGGDYMDYFENDSGDWVLVVADICGKGVPAALLMTVLRSTFRIEARSRTSARELLCAVNAAMRINLDRKSFVTAACLIITRDGTRMSYSRAGHPMLVHASGDGEPNHIECAGIALGLVNNTSVFEELIEEHTVDLNPGDRFLLYTDGLTEATNTDKASYGTERLFACLHDSRAKDADGIIEALLADVKKFMAGEPAFDDLTLLAFRVEE